MHVSGGGDEGKGGVYLRAPPSVQRQRVARALATLQDGGPPVGMRRGGGAQKKRGEGASKLVLASPPHTHAKGGGHCQWVEEEGG
jgi:hypothetical protein